MSTAGKVTAEGRTWGGETDDGDAWEAWGEMGGVNADEGDERHGDGDAVQWAAQREETIQGNMIQLHD